MYSFSKSQRFPDLHGSYCNQVFYDMPPAETVTHSAGFGIGNRFRYKKNETPSPGTYTLKLDRQLPVYSFGRPRNSSEDMRKTVKHAAPGPGAYDHQSHMGKDGLKFSLYPKIKGFAARAEDASMRVPGPGQYQD